MPKSRRGAQTDGTERALVDLMLEPVAAVHEPHRALRALMRRSLESIGFLTVESESPGQLALVLSTSSLVIAPHAFLVVPELVAEACYPSITALGRRRMDSRLPLPYLVTTREFGDNEERPPKDFPNCISLGHLEKPFDLSTLQALAQRCCGSEPSASSPNGPG